MRPSMAVRLTLEVVAVIFRPSGRVQTRPHWPTGTHDSISLLAVVDVVSRHEPGTVSYSREIQMAILQAMTDEMGRLVQSLHLRRSGEAGGLAA